MNCISDFVCDYHSKYGLIESVNIISINDDDCAINIFSNKSLIRTSIVNVKILRKPHEKLYEIDKLDTKQNLILSIDNYSCMVKAIKIHDDDSVEVMPTSDLLLNNEPTKRVSINNLSVCGEYENFEALRSISIPMPCEYSRYFNNIVIFKPLLLHSKNTMICWNAEELQLKVLAFDEVSLKRIEFLMPVFISQLSILSCGKQLRSIDALASYIVWEYQYENEEEANYAIGPKGSHILAVRNLRGIAGVVLTKSNRLRIIAENKFSLKEARALLEIRRDTYMFDDSFIPILIGKNASHITELVHKAGLHCIHVPHCAWSGVVNDYVTVSDRSIAHTGKRELQLFGTAESIISAKLLLEMEESVKDLKREFELRKHSKMRRHSFSLKSSTSSISAKEEPQGEKQPNQQQQQQQQQQCDDDPEEVFEDKAAKPPSQPLLWADAQDDSGGEDGRGAVGGGYLDFFSSQTTAARMRRAKKSNNNWGGQAEPRHSSGGYHQHNKRGGGAGGRKAPQGGMLFTNSMLAGSNTSANVDSDGGELAPSQYHHQQQQQHHPQKHVNHNNSNNNNNRSNNRNSNNSSHSNNNHQLPPQQQHHQQQHNFRPKNQPDNRRTDEQLDRRHVNSVPHQATL